MVRHWVTLVIGYWTLRTFTGDLPSNVDEPVVVWLREVIIDPLTFIRSAFFFLAGLIAYSMVLSEILTIRMSSQLHKFLLAISFLISFITHYFSNAVVTLFCLLCLFIYGMISVSQSRTKETKRRQEGVE